MSVRIKSMIHDAGGVRAISVRWVFRAELRLESATHLGGGLGEIADMVVLRDKRSGSPLLLGTSLGGALRSYLGDVLGGYRSQEDTCVAELFGGARGLESGDQSPLIVFDSLGEIPKDKMAEIRDGVQIDPRWGVAEDKKKYDFEVIPAGTTFPLRFDLLIPDMDQEDFLVSLLVAALQGLARGEISLGARRSRGLGKVQATRWWANRYDLTSREGWLEWTLSEYWEPDQQLLPENSASSSPEEACRRTYDKIDLKSFEDKRECIRADLQFEIQGSLLIRSAPGVTDAPDVVHLHTSGRPVLPGTSLVGVLRSHALRIARLMRGAAGDSLVTRLFGPRLEGTTFKDFAPSASKLRVSESFIENPTKKNQTRIAVDRFTGGVAKGALFDEQVLQKGRIMVHLEIRNPTEEEAGLLVLLIRDLLAGEIPVGGGASVGRGILKGTGSICFPGNKKVVIGKDLYVDDEGRKMLDNKIKSFVEGGGG